MQPSPYLAIAARVAGTLGQIAWDWAARPLGGSLPLDPAHVSDPAFLNELLRTCPGDSEAARLRIADARMLDIQSTSSNCNNVVLALEHEREATESGAEPSNLPRTAFLKLPAPELLTRVFCNVIRVWELECRFYRTVAPRVPIRTPRAYAVSNRGTRFVLLLEDLHADPRVELHTNHDMLAGPSIDRVERCLETLAKLHASFTGLPLSEREALLPIELHPFNSPFMRGFGRLTGQLSIGPCRRKAPGLLTDDLVALFQRGLDHWDLMLGAWFSEPLTLIHGDSHLGNFFVDGDRMGMLDWQAAQWGQGIRDVQYLLIDSLPESLLATNEEALVRHYVSALESHGVSLPFDEAWRQYRGLSFQTWLTIIVSLGTNAMIDMDEIMLEILARSNAAIRRLRFGEWLDELIDSA